MKHHGWFLTVALWILEGCSDDPSMASGAVVTEVDTRWTLLTVDDRGLPTRQRVTFEAAALVTRARLSVAADGTWTYRYDHLDTHGAEASETSSGATGTYESMSMEPPMLRMLDGETQETFYATYKQGILEVLMRGQVLRFVRAP